MPPDCVLIIPDLMPEPHESYEAFSARLAAASTVITNVGNPGAVELTTPNERS